MTGTQVVTKPRRRLLRNAAWVCLALLVIAAVFRGRLIAALQPLIERELSRATGFTVSFESANLKIVPYLGVRFTGGRAVSPDGCSTWSIGSVSARVRLRPLLHRSVEVRKLEVDQLVGRFGVEEGKVILVSDAGEPCKAPAAAAQAMPTRAAPSFEEDLNLSLELDVFQVRGAQAAVHYYGEEHSVKLDELQATLTAAAGNLDIAKLIFAGEVDGIPVSLDASDVALGASGKSIRIPRADLSFGAQSVAVSGQYDASAGTGNALVHAEHLSLKDLHLVLGAGAPRFTGEASGMVEATLSGSEVAVAGDAKLSGVRSEQGGGGSLGHLSLTGIKALLSKGELTKASAALSVGDFRCASEGDHYSLGAANGAVEFSAGEQQKIDASLEVRDFGFADSDTKIERVGAALRDIVVVITPKGDVDVRLKLDAKSIHLTNPNIEIFSVDSVRSPIRVAVPIAGGYEVSGPVTVSGGRMKILGREFAETGGTIQMSVASALKTFVSQNLSTQINGEVAGALANFAMTNAAYTVKSTEVTVGGGTIEVGLTMGRHRKGPVSAAISVKQVSIPPAYRALVTAQGDPPMRGKVASLQLNAKGDSSDIPQSVSGDGSVLLSGAVFKTIDIQRLVQGAVAAIPAIGQEITPGKDTQQISDGSIASLLKLGGGKVGLSDLRVQYSNFTVKGALQAGFDGTLGGQVRVVCLEDTFRMLGFGIKPLADFLAREGRVAIPLTVSGTLSDPSVSLDTDAVERFATGQDLAEGVRSAFGGEATPAPTPSSR